MVGVDGADDRPESASISLGDLLDPEVTRCNQGREHHEVAPVPGVRITGVGVRGRLHHECADEVRSQDMALATINLNRDDLGSIQRLSAASRGQCRAPGYSPAQRSTLADAIGQQHVERGIAALPSMLESLGRDPVGLETQVREDLGEGAQHGRLGPDIDDSIRIVGRTRREGTSLGTMQVHELATDQGLARVESLKQIQDTVPGRGLLDRHRGSTIIGSPL